MEYNFNRSIDFNLSNERMENTEIEKEVIVCSDESLMKYIVEVTEILLESIWRSSKIVQPHLCPLHEYLCHVIRQSKITLYTLKCAIIYFVRISRQLQDKRWRSKIRLFCGRRMFLGSVIIASKYLYDRTYSNSMWAKILGLDIKEVNNIQMDFLEALNYELFISKELDIIWSQMLENFISYLKARNEEREYQEFEDDLVDHRNGLSSPINSPAVSIPMKKSTFVPGARQSYPNSPISPVSSLKTINNYETERNVTLMRTNFIERERNASLNPMIREEYKRLEEYRPFVKVLIQVIFVYSSKNAFPTGEKRVIELPKLATTPELLFFGTMGNMNCGVKYSGMKAGNQYSLLQLRKRLSANKINATRKVQLFKYYFNQAYPNHHLVNKLYRSSATTGYYSDSTVKHLSSFHYYKRRLNYRRVKEANDEVCGVKVQNELVVGGEGGEGEDQNSHGPVTAKEETQEKCQSCLSSSSSSEWDSTYDDSSTLIGSSDEEGMMNEQHYGPNFNEMDNYTQKVFGGDGYEFNQGMDYDQSSYWDSVNYKKLKSLNHEQSKRHIPITPSVDSEENDFNSTKAILPSSQPQSQQSPSSQKMNRSNCKQLYHPKIVYPNQK